MIKRKLFNKVKRRDRIFSGYPCSYYLHNALKFISDNKPDEAYQEICHALLKSGGSLYDEEENKFKQLLEKQRG